MRHRPTTLATALAVAALAQGAGAQIVTNGSFESPPAAVGSFTTRGGTDLTGWTIVGNVDHIGDGLWQHADGVQSLDLNGSAGAATIFQDLTLLVGAQYRLSFAMGENSAGGPDTKTMAVSVGSVDLGGFSFDNPAESFQAMNWQTFTRDFTADAATMRLTFASTTADCCWGPALDAVSVVRVSAVPEPATVALVGGGLGLLGLVARRRPRA